MNKILLRFRTYLCPHTVVHILCIKYVCIKIAENRTSYEQMIKIDMLADHRRGQGVQWVQMHPEGKEKKFCGLI